jgi:hypothetical protein
MSATEFRSAVEIAKDIRRDIKRAVADGSLPADLKVSVRARYFAGGQSIDITWSAGTGTHELVCYHHRCPFRHCLGAPDDHLTHTMLIDLSEHGRFVQSRLAAIADAYNWDNSDVMTDYFDVLFYCVPQWEWSARLTAANIVNLDRQVAQTFLVLHLDDHMPSWPALQAAVKLEGVSL